MADLNDIRTRIDAVDAQIIELFRERMDLSDEVAAYKRENGLPVLDKKRERAKIQRVSLSAREDLQGSTAVLFSLLMEMSKARQNAQLATNDELVSRIGRAEEESPKMLPRNATVACQGVEGAYSQIATERAFSRPIILYRDTFADVFRTVSEGEADYGVIPLENSTAGTVSAVYDLMKGSDFFIVRTVRLKVDHNLMARPGTRIEDITDVYSHEQAISQCRRFLSSPRMHDARVHMRPNTALAAKMVAESDSPHVAALCSRSCADLYGLAPLAECVQDQGSNFTRFAVISQELQILPGADKTSLMMTVGHEPGNLYKVLARFFALDINLTKLESRPIPGRDFEFMFYFDLECPVVAPEFTALMNSLGEISDRYRYLGSYHEQV